MLTHDRPLGRWARPRRASRAGWDADLPTAPGRRRVLAQRLTRVLALAAGAGLGLPLLLTWVQLNQPTGVGLPWQLYALSWAWAAVLALLALVVAVWTAPIRSAPASSVTGALARRWRSRHAARAVRGSAPGRAGSAPLRGTRLVALVAGATAVLLLVLALA